ncbi:WbuC family cupin fold metalloprotein [Candidatus Pelagibacter sp.]|nr:WbuC family cupin fold metalloprotein [Candidatus Pelagibacter sp.]
MNKIPFFSKKNFNYDNSGKSPAFFIKNDNVKINQNFYDNLIKFSKINKNINCRVCIHKNKKAKLHSMIVLINSKNKFAIHKHSKTSEIYQLIKGSMKINLFKNNKKVKSVIIKKKGEIFSVLRNQLHIVVPVSNIAIFHETKLNEYK